MALLEPKRAIGEIKPNKKGWQIPSATLLVFAIIVGVVVAAGDKKPAVPTGSSFSQNETSSFSERSDYADEHSSSQTPPDHDNNQNTTSKTVNVVRPSSSDYDYSTSSLPSWRDEHLWPLSSSSSETFTSTSSKKSTSSKNSTSTSSKASTSNGIYSRPEPDIKVDTSKTYIEGNYSYCVSSSNAIITDVYNKISGDIVIPSELGGYPVTVINDEAFMDCTLITSVVVPDSVVSIKDKAFYNCNNITNVKLSNDIFTIGASAFEYCEKLVTINLPDSLESISERTFTRCSALTGIVIPKSVKSIGANAFYDCSSSTSINIPDGVTSIPSKTFFSCNNLESITFPDTLTSIGTSAFDACFKLTNLTIPSNLTNISSTAFVYANTNYTTSLTFKEGYSKIDTQGFSKFYNLKQIYLPKSLTQITAGAFAHCDDITDIYYAGSPKDKEKLLIGANNDALVFSATWHYNSDY